MNIRGKILPVRRVLNVFCLALPLCLWAGCISGYQTAIHAAIDGISARDDSGVLKVSGDVTVVSDGERHRTSMILRHLGNSRISCDFYTLWGAPVVSVIADSLEAEIRFGKRILRLGTDAPMELPGYFFRTPFTFNQFIRILGGMLPVDVASGGLMVDSIPSREKRAAIAWRHEGYQVTVTHAGAGKRVRQVVLEPSPDAMWTLAFSRFRDGIPGEVVFRRDEANYFIVRFDRIVGKKPEG